MARAELEWQAPDVAPEVIDTDFHTAAAEAGVKRRSDLSGKEDKVNKGNEGNKGNEEELKPLTLEEARKVQALNPPVSLWKVVAGQAGVGLMVALLAWGVTGNVQMLWSAGYGALAVVLPAALFARGLSRQKSALHGNAALVGFFVWEMVKVVLTVAMLFAAPKLVEGLNWLALLAGFVVTMKVYWVAMWFRPERKKPINNFEN